MPRRRTGGRTGPLLPPGEVARATERAEQVVDRENEAIRQRVENIRRGFESVGVSFQETAEAARSTGQAVRSMVERVSGPHHGIEVPARGCGRRIAGGLYLESGYDAGQSMTGRQLAVTTRYILDPPVKVDLAAMGVTSVGVKLIERNGVTHVLDMVGADNYPNVADFIEEAARMGVSRRLPLNTDLSRLTSQSLLILIHARAWVENVNDLRPAEVDGIERSYWCPKINHAHMMGEHPCAGMWWDDVSVGGTSPFNPAMERARDEGAVARPMFTSIVRQMPWGEYHARRSARVGSIVHSPAIFARFPITSLAVIRDPVARSDIRTWERLSGYGAASGSLNGLPPSLVCLRERYEVGHEGRSSGLDGQGVGRVAEVAEDRVEPGAWDTDREHVAVEPVLAEMGVDPECLQFGVELASLLALGLWERNREEDWELSGHCGNPRSVERTSDESVITI